MDMDILSLLMGYVLKGIKKSKVTETVTTDFKEALNNDLIELWKKIKPIFIVEDKKLVEKIENNPDDDIAQAGLKYKLYQKLEDTEFKEMVSGIIEKIQKLEKENNSKIVKNNKINNKGSHNIIIQDSKISGEINKPLK
jgi:hypothetical protein